MNLLEQHRKWEWELYAPLVGSTMLELGNKKKSAGDVTFTYKDVFKSLGFAHTSVDTNGLDGALPKDLRKPLGLGTFDIVSNIGTTEHVSENDWSGQVACWQNIMEAMHVGSVLVSITPKPGCWPNHGTWYPHKEFFAELASLNVLELERCYDSIDRGDTVAPHLRLVYARLRRVSDAPFLMPDKGMHRNHR